MAAMFLITERILLAAEDISFRWWSMPSSITVEFPWSRHRLQMFRFTCYLPRHFY